MPEDDRIPIVGTHRGVGIHAFQPRERIDRVVKPAIDAVFGLSDPDALTDYVQDPTHPPEARLFAAARVEALWQLAADNRELRPKVSLTLLRAMTAGLDSLRWIDPRHYGSLLQHPRGPGLSLPARDAGEREQIARAQAPL